jgi:uncharacterized membrane protein
MPASATLRLAFGALGGLVYVLVCYALMTQAKDSAWSVVLVLSPMMLAITLGCWRSGYRLAACGVALALMALAGHAYAGPGRPMTWLYLAQDVGIHLFLALGFASTLRPGRTALITMLAQKVHRQFTPAMAAYTRQLTVMWVTYFLGMSLLSVTIYAWTTFDTWALYANLISPLSVAALFVAEYVIRYRMHPEFERVSLSAAIQSYMNSGKSAASRDPSA